MCLSESGWDGVLSENGKKVMMRWEVTRVYMNLDETVH